MNKMVINHLDKLFVTSDAATMLHELEVQHPAAKMLLFASQMQEQECGDGTNWVLIFSGALLDSAEELLRMVCFYICPIFFIHSLNVKSFEILWNVYCF